jgi:hypothetical protein
MNEKFLVCNEQVVWSDLILVNAKNFSWAPFNSFIGGYNERHTLAGLKQWMKKGKATGWKEEFLKKTDHEQIYLYGELILWIPFDIPNPDKVYRRTLEKRNIDSPYTADSGWNIFSPARNIEELRSWMEENLVGWDANDLHQKSGCDQRVWVHGDENKSHDEFWIPTTTTPTKILPTNQQFATCRNPLGCSLTLGKTYQVLGQEDDLLVLVDDLGVKGTFLPERFT